MLARAREIETRIESARTSEQTAVARSAELQRLVSHLEVQIRDLINQRDAAATREAEANQARHALGERLLQLERDAQSERASLSAHIQATESRASLEIDRARQEVRELRTRLKTLTKSQAEVERNLREAAEAANAAAVEARQKLLAERARADALDQQLSNLRDLPAALKAAMQRPSRKSEAGSQSRVGTRRRRD
jgi:chromosome segregation ATPase